MHRVTLRRRNLQELSSWREGILETAECKESKLPKAQFGTSNRFDVVQMYFRVSELSGHINLSADNNLNYSVTPIVVLHQGTLLA